MQHRFQTLPAYITEANPQVKNDKLLGWEANNSQWITGCVSYLQTWNASIGTQPVNDVVFYRWAHDEWRLDDKTLILNQIKAEAKKLGIGG